MRKKFSIPHFQAKLPFGGSVRRAAGFAFERKALILLALMIGAGALIYASMIAASVSQVVAREELAKESSRLSASIARLEREYLTKGGAITESYARSIGFVTPSSQLFLEAGGSLSLSNAR